MHGGNAWSAAPFQSPPQRLNGGRGSPPLVSIAQRPSFFVRIAVSGDGHASKQEAHQRHIFHEAARVRVVNDLVYEMHTHSIAVAILCFTVQINVKN
jgi:hypothetical protein